MMPPALAQAFAHQGQACTALGSPFMGQLCALLRSRDWPATPLRDRYFAWEGDIGPSAASLPLRLAGGLHALAINGDALAHVYPLQAVDNDTLWAFVSDAMIREPAFLDRWSDSAPQTNEVRHAAALIAVGRLLAQRFDLPLRLSELGASGGLNLMWDRFALRVGGTTYGPADSVILAPDWTGPPPLDAQPNVIAKRGVDLNPLDPGDPDDQLRLRAYLWQDQPDRMTRTRAAIEISDAQVDQGDAIDWLAGQLDPVAGQIHLIYHTIAWQYFPPDVQARGTAMISDAGARATHDASFARFAMEADGATPGAALTLRIWPGDITIDLGRADFHGHWINWKGWA